MSDEYKKLMEGLEKRDKAIKVYHESLLKELNRMNNTISDIKKSINHLQYALSTFDEEEIKRLIEIDDKIAENQNVCKILIQYIGDDENEFSKVTGILQKESLSLVKEQGKILSRK